MLKKSAIKRIIISTMGLVILLLLCIFPSNNPQIAEEVIYVEEMTLPIYILDKNEYVARTNIVKKENEVIPYIISALTINSPYNAYIPNGFYAIIPKDTKLINYSLENDLLKLNFSKEFLNTSLENEEKVIEALIFSLCELDNVKKLMIFVDGESLAELPNSHKKLPLVLDKTYGINKVYNFNNIKNTTKTTIYYMSKYNDDLYYIPITKITNDDIEPVEVIINELKSTPIYETNLISYLNASYELKEYEILQNSISLSFNNYMLANLDNSSINEEVKYSLSLSIRDTYDMDDIVININ